MDKKSVAEVRRANARALLTGVGTKEFCRRSGINSRQYLTQLTGPNPSRSISADRARVIEQGFSKPRFWMDEPHDPEEPPGPEEPPEQIRPHQLLLLRQQLSAARMAAQALVEQLEEIERKLQRFSSVVVVFVIAWAIADV